MYFVYEEDENVCKEKISRLRKDITRQMVLDLKEKDYSFQKIAKTLNCSTKTIYNRLNAKMTERNVREYVEKVER